MPSLESKLKALQKKSAQKGHWQLVAAVASLLPEKESVDARINLVGAMHEVGLLSNSLAPYWAAWRSTPDEANVWALRCIDRLHACDSDYWALAGNMTSISGPAPIGFLYSQEEGLWELIVYPKSVELVGGAEDGQIVSPGFSLDLEQLRGAFDRVDACSWESLGNPDDEGP